MTLANLVTGHEMVTHNNTLANLTRGIGERVLYTNKQLSRPVQPLSGVFVGRLASYRRAIVKRLGWQSPVARQDFVGFYRGPRQTLYQRAVDGLEVSPIRPKDAYLKTFVKAEKINLSLKDDPAPRVIQPRSPRYNVEVGRYLRPVEKLIYKAIDELFGRPTIMSEYNAYTQAKVLREKWQRFSEPVCVGLDASRFDQHVSTQALKFEHKLYDMIFRSKELRRLLTWQLRNVGYANATDGTIKYIKYGSRMSGDMNTSLGNKILMCLMAKSFLDDIGLEADFANNGDDCLLFMEKENLHKISGLKSYFLDFGFNIVSEEPVYEFEKVVFCQTQPIQCNGIWRMVRSLKTCISKDLTCTNLGHREDEFRGWLTDVGTCGLAVGGDVPVMGSFYRMLKRVGTAHKYSGSSDNAYRWYNVASKNAKLLHIATDDAGRLSFYNATGLIPDEQIALEEYFDSVVWGGSKRQLTTTLSYLFNGST
jgi:hypothetical protein